jgi:hypothetical protein
MNKKTKLSQLRAHIKRLVSENLPVPTGTFSTQVGPAVKSKIGGRRQQLDRILATIDTDRLSRLPREQKVDLLVALMNQFGIDNRDFAAIKSRVQRTLTTTMASPETPAMPTESKKINKRSAVNEAEYATQGPENVKGALAARGERLKRTQAYQQLLAALENQPSTNQSEFILNLLSELPLDAAAKQRIKMKIRTRLTDDK